MWSVRQRLAREEGFTLIELLAVLLIISILLAIAIPSYLGFQQQAQETAAAADVREAIPDAEAYYSDNGNFTALSLTTMQAYDSGLVAYSSSTPGIKTVKGGATHFCISAGDSGHYAHVVGPGGQVIYKEITDYCSTWTAS